MNWNGLAYLLTYFRALSKKLCWVDYLHQVKSVDSRLIFAESADEKLEKHVPHRSYLKVVHHQVLQVWKVKLAHNLSPRHHVNDHIRFYF